MFFKEGDRVRNIKKSDMIGTIIRFLDKNHTQFIVKLDNGQWWRGTTYTFASEFASASDVQNEYSQVRWN